MSVPRLPAELTRGGPGAAFWRAVTECWRLEGHHTAILREACLALDRAEGARQRIDADGATVADRYGTPKAHPAAAIERDALSTFARLTRLLGISDSDTAPGRPPRVGRPGAGMED